MQSSSANKPAWTFLTNHSHVLVCLVRDPGVRLKEVAVRVGVTERAVQRIVAELEAAGIITRTREGRRNTYAVDESVKLRHPLESQHSIGDLISRISR